MDACDVVVVGGGPAGSSCAWALARAGLDTVIVDKAPFPRDKVCADWITPQVLEALEIDPSEYGQGRILQPITGFRTSRLGSSSGRMELETRFDAPVSCGIRRWEFDHYLLQRSGARLRTPQPVTGVRRNRDHWIVDDLLRAPVIVGAGGHFCPIARQLTRHRRPAPIVVAQEIEVRLDAAESACPVAGDTPELFFSPDLRGYGWCFRKGRYLNVEFGRQDTRHFPARARAFAGALRARRRVPPDLPDTWRGHAYLTYGSSPRPAVGDGVLLVEDAAGLAYPQSGEGIRPAVESGLMAARAILLAEGRYDRARLDSYARWLEERYGHPAWSRGLRAALPPVVARTAARWLLTVPWFARHLVLARWFLHAHQPALRFAPTSMVRRNATARASALAQ